MQSPSGSLRRPLVPIVDRVTRSLARRLSRRANTALVAGLICMVSACTGTGDAVTTATGTGPGLELSDLSGVWANDSTILRINDAGDFLIQAAASPDQVLMGGFVARDELRFIFVTGVGGACPGARGVYTASVEGEVLTLTLDEDPCEERASWFETPLDAAEG